IVRTPLPVERIERWIGEAGVKYVRVPTDQFERLAEAQGDGGPRDRPGETYLRTATISARLAEDNTLLGSAVLEIHHLADGPSFLRLSPCTLALRESDDPAAGRGFARWAGKPARRATIGMSDDGRLGVFVERSGELEFAWSLRGRPPAERP